MILVPIDNLKASAEFFSDGELEAQIADCLGVLMQFADGIIGHDSGDWVGYEPCLWVYAYTLYREWKARNPDSIFRLGEAVLTFKPDRELIKPHTLVYPPWFGDKTIHAAHKEQS